MSTAIEDVLHQMLRAGEHSDHATRSIPNALIFLDGKIFVEYANGAPSCICDSIDAVASWIAADMERVPGI